MYLCVFVCVCVCVFVCACRLYIKMDIEPVLANSLPNSGGSSGVGHTYGCGGGSSDRSMNMIIYFHCKVGIVTKMTKW